LKGALKHLKSALLFICFLIKEWYNINKLFLFIQETKIACLGPNLEAREVAGEGSKGGVFRRLWRFRMRVNMVLLILFMGL